MNTPLPNLHQAKAQAKTLRADMAEQGTKLGHAQALEQVAHRHGFRDWNALYAAIKDLPPGSWAVGDAVTGHYLSQPFDGTILAATPLRPGWFRLEIDLNQPIDVVTSAHFSNHRTRLRGDVGPDGHSMDRTSDGTPHLIISM